MKNLVVILSVTFFFSNLIIFWVFAEDEISSIWNWINAEIITKKSALTDKQREMVTKKIEWKSNLFYIKFLEKVNEAIIKTKNEDLKAKLEDLKEMVQAKIDFVQKM